MPLMIESTAEKIAFSIAVEQQMIKVIGEMQRRGLNPKVNIPKHIVEDLKRVRRMHNRYRINQDSRHTDIEEKAEQNVASWLIEQWNSMNGRKTPKTQWTKQGTRNIDFDI